MINFVYSIALSISLLLTNCEKVPSTFHDELKADWRFAPLNDSYKIT